jgi:RNase P subunit RPR2
MEAENERLREQVAQYEAAIEHNRDRNRRNYYSDLEHHRKRKREYVARRNKEQRAARDTKFMAREKLRQAVRSGRLKKPTSCSECHKELPPRKIHGHHLDYANPLDVVWLCVSCHGHTWRVHIPKP